MGKRRLSFVGIGITTNGMGSRGKNINRKRRNCETGVESSAFRLLLWKVVRAYEYLRNDRDAGCTERSG